MQNAICLLRIIAVMFISMYIIGINASTVMANINLSLKYTIMPYEYAMTRLKNIEGNWYNSKGELILTVKNGYINGCKVMAYLSCGDAEGYRIKEANGYRDIGLVIDHNNYKKFVYLDEKTVLRPTPRPQYVESISGLYLGMSKTDLLDKYGNPDKIEKLSQAFPCERWTYNGAFKIFFTGDMVSTITLPYGSTFKFDRCGLMASSPESKYRNIYSGRSNSGGIKIAEGEYIEFGKGTVELTAYN